MFFTLARLAPSGGTSFSSNASRVFKRAQAGLFDGRIRQSGNNVPNSKQKTARTWLPNVQSKRLFSPSLGKTIKLAVTTKALRSIDKLGGLDAYLLKMKDDKLGRKGVELRELIKAKQREIALVKDSGRS